MSEFNSSFEPPEDSLTAMLLKKEKELQQLSKLRINQLQEQIIFKERTIFDLESQIRRLNDDLTYNLSLIQQRDEEIVDLESTIASFMDDSHSYTSEISNLKIELKNFQMKLERSEEYIRELQGSREGCNEMQTKLQEAYSQISKLKYQEEFNSEKYREIENNSLELSNMNEHFKENIKEKENMINKLLYNQENFEREKSDFALKLKNEKEKYEREINIIKSKHANEIRLVKDLKESSTEQLSYNHKIQIENLQGQVKTLLEDNKKSNKQIDYYQNSLLDKEKTLTQEIYELRKEVTFNLQQIEELRASGRGKDMEIDSIKEHIDHWKNLAQNRADELFKYKQLQIRSEEKAENYLKELDTVKNESFNEIQKLKKEIETFVQEKKKKKNSVTDKKKKYNEIKAEVERLNDFIYNKDKENSRLEMLVDSLRKEKEYKFVQNEESKNSSIKTVNFKDINCQDIYSQNSNKLRSLSRENSYGKPNRSKIYQVKNSLDKKFLESTKN